MDGWANLDLMVAGLAGATFLWIGLLVFIEGERRAGVKLALGVTAIALALFYYSELARALFPHWKNIHQRLVGWLIATITVGWYVTAMFHTRGVFSRRRWRWPLYGLLFFCLWAGALAAISSVRPELFQSSSTASDATPWFYLLRVAQVLVTLLAGLAIYLRAYAIYRHDGEREIRQRSDLLIWFIPASICAVAAALLISLAPWLGVAMTQFGSRSPVVHWPGLTAALGCASFLLGALATNRKLLGRPIRTPYLFGHWALLALLLAALAAPFWLGTARQGYELLLMAVIAPVIIAAVGWGRRRVYQHYVAMYGHFLNDSIGGWPGSDPEVLHGQAQRVFDTLLEELRPHACYLRLQANPHEKPLELNHGLMPILTQPRPSKRYDLVQVEVGGQQLGFMVLSGPRSLAYSALELDLARSCAYSIANLYLYSRQAQLLESLVVRREHERREHNQRLQRVLHDQVVGNLDTIHKARDMIVTTNHDLVDEIGEAAEESMALIRSLLRDELADLYPTALLREGVIAAIKTNLLPRYHNERYPHMVISLETDGMSDSLLNAWLSDEQKRALYGALYEAINNAAKYAGGDLHQPFWVRVRFGYDSDGLLAEVRDSGIGFVPELAGSEGGMGLYYHHAALRMAGGTLVVESNPGAGTNVRLRLPANVLCQARHARPLVHPPTLVAHSGLEWWRLIFDTERHPGGRLLINDHLSDLTRPGPVRLAFYRCRTSDEQLVYRFVEIDEERHQIFMQYVRDYSFRDLVDRRRLLRYVATGVTDRGYPGISVSLACMHMRNVIWLLRTCENYHLALSDQPFEANIAVKPGCAVLWEKRTENGDTRLDGIYEGIRDTDSSTVAEFTRRFEAAWAAVPAHFREKQHVITWLEEQLAEAERNEHGDWWDKAA